MSAGKITPQSLQFANAINEVANRDKITPNDTPRADAIAPVGYARAQDLLLYREVWAGYSNKPADENGHPPVALYTQDQVDALLAAERERADRLMRLAYLAGWNASGEGYNAEYPFGDSDMDPEADAKWIAVRDTALDAARRK